MTAPAWNAETIERHAMALLAHRWRSEASRPWHEVDAVERACRAAGMALVWGWVPRVPFAHRTVRILVRAYIERHEEIGRGVGTGGAP